MMSKWILKAIIQKTISIFPFRQKLNHFFQKYVTKGIELSDEHFIYKLEHARDHISYFREHFKNKGNANILELGTGWYPVIPLCYWLQDLGNVTSIDLSSWMNSRTQRRLVERMKEFDEISEGLEPYLQSRNASKWKKLIGFLDRKEWPVDEFNTMIGLRPIVGDARNLQFENDEFDFICSNNTFEHIYPVILKDILKEFQRLLKPGGMMSHFIDLSDHFAHFDSSITIYNFLKYSRAQWKIIDNSIQPQNRLRFKDYEHMYKELNIPIGKCILREWNAHDLKKVKVHREFSAYSFEELGISHGYIISDSALRSF